MEFGEMGIKLFCLPYAGASANIYMRWKKYLHNSIDMRLLEMPGRGMRQDVPFYKSVDEAVDDVYKMMKNEIDNEPYAILGHSMGCIIGYELLWKLYQSNCNPPLHAFFSGRKAPHIKENESEDTYKLPDDEFEKEIMKLGGTSSELFEHEELKSIFLPILRADYEICNKYNYIDRGKLNYRLSIFYGQDDEMSFYEVNQWREHTNKECRIHKFNGGHFFINNYTEDIVNEINYMLIGDKEENHMYNFL
jgi:surfactin synthase thioesterase subunit